MRVHLLLLPLALAVVTQLLARRSSRVRTFEGGALNAMVPLMMLTLAVVVGSQVDAVAGAL